MAHLKSCIRILSQASRTCQPVATRNISSKASQGIYKSARPLLLGGVTVGTGYGVYKYIHSDNSPLTEVLTRLPSVSAASPPPSQPSVYSEGKNHALYLWIHLKPTANARDVAKAVAKLQKYVDQVTDPTMKDDEDEILAGVGFGPNFYNQIAGKTRKSFTYPHRKGVLGDMPSSGGDVFIHAKCNTYSKLFELTHVILKNLPKDSIENFEDIYSFVYRNGRDLSGFIDGTENRADEDGRRETAVERETGGSYVITQKWLHQFDVIATEKDKTLESWIGRAKLDSTELNRKTVSSHVARMTSGNTFNAPKPLEIVRQSMPFGTLAGEKGLFFIGYAASPQNFEYMLDRMVGSGGDGHCDDIMRLTKNSKGTYWYFPGAAELKKLE